MPNQFHSPINLNLNELQNALLQVLGSNPGTGTEGQIWYNSVTKKLMFRSDAGNIDVTARANHSGTQLATTISDFSTAADARITAANLQAADADLTAIAALTPSNDDILQRKAGAWTNRTAAQLKTDLALIKADVGLGNVDNTADTAKPVSTAQQTALDLKANLASPTLTGTPAAPTAAAGTNTTQLATTAFTIAEIVARFASNDVMQYKGAIDASTNPNYPAANAGDTYRISVAGKIGGASGANVEAGDMLIAFVDASAAGTHATVGGNWNVIQVNIDGAVTLTGTQTLTNKTISALVNTITNIGASSVIADLITGQTAETAIADADVILLWDASAGALRKMTKANFVAGLGGSFTPYSATIGNGSATSFTITQATHGKRSDSSNIVVVQDATTGEVVYPNIVVNPANGTVTIAFSPTAPASAAYRVHVS